MIYQLSFVSKHRLLVYIFVWSLCIFIPIFTLAQSKTLETKQPHILEQLYFTTTFSTQQNNFFQSHQFKSIQLEEFDIEQLIFLGYVNLDIKQEKYQFIVKLQEKIHYLQLFDKITKQQYILMSFNKGILILKNAQGNTLEFDLKPY